MRLEENQGLDGVGLFLDGLLMILDFILRAMGKSSEIFSREMSSLYSSSLPINSYVN